MLLPYRVFTIACGALMFTLRLNEIPMIPIFLTNVNMQSKVECNFLAVVIKVDWTAWRPEGLFGPVVHSDGTSRVVFIMADKHQNFLRQWRLYLLLLLLSPYFFYVSTNTYVSRRRSLDDPWASQWSTTCWPLIDYYMPPASSRAKTKNKTYTYTQTYTKHIHSYRHTDKKTYFTICYRERRFRYINTIMLSFN